MREGAVGPRRRDAQWTRAYQEEAPGDRRSPERRRELLDTAAEVFAAQGYNATTVRKIADEAGHARGQPLLPLRLQGIDARRDPLRPSSTSSGRATTPSWPPDSAPARPSRPWSPSPSGRSTGTAPPSPSTRRSPGTSPPSRASRYPRRLPAEVREGLARHAGARRRRRGLPRRPRHPAHLPLRPRHRLGRRVLVPARRTAQPRGDRPPVPVDGPGRHRRTAT